MPSIRVRRASKDDLGEYYRLQLERWDKKNSATPEQLASRLKSYPQGMLVAEELGKVVGMVYATRITGYDYESPPSWYEVTNNGMCDKPDLNGKVMYGVDLSTDKNVGARAGNKLLVGVGRLCIRENVEWCMLGGRMPGYHKYKAKMTPNEYMWAKNRKGEFLDKQVKFYASAPGLRIVQVLPNYFHDPASDDNGVLLRWHNPFFGWPFPRFISAIFPFLFKLEELYVKLAKFFKRKT